MVKYPALCFLISITSTLTHPSSFKDFLKPKRITNIPKSEDQMLFELESTIKENPEYKELTLQIAIQSKSEKIFNLCLKYADDKDIAIALDKEIINKNIKNIQWLLDHKVNVNVNLLGGHTCLKSAVNTNDEKIVELLLNHGADVNFLAEYDINSMYYSFYENSALMLAAENGNENIVQLLLKHGANVNSENYSNDTALSFSTKSLNIVKMLLEHNASITSKALEAAIVNANEEVVKLFLNHGYNLNLSRALTQAINSYNDLFFAPKNTIRNQSYFINLEKIIKLLLKHNANPNEKGQFNKNSFDYLYDGKEYPFLGYLLKKQEDLNQELPYKYKNDPYWKNINISKFFDEKANSLKTLTLKKLYEEYLARKNPSISYEEYLAGKKLPILPLENLASLIANPQTANEFKDYFKPDFIAEMKREIVNNLI